MSTLMMYQLILKSNIETCITSLPDLAKRGGGNNY
jgi:hypothetical protein